ncbi:hypothetical protein JoomaDRAFT_1864 [Galbibacter orientalis DSM 19592]|uniref:Lipoprotein n=1 Tax=Galbibacter orientalis DSM 19592 TaxID=926559 RepID=I3C5H0_9FLAO|nr:hypothetical protein [Galbibacter orientalis]EIJ38863.1 hypothetical protein JoomaDRAFT_1864 [Galbibacter orientalis DSM 19592]
MKKIRYIVVGVLGLIFGVSSCSTDDKIVDEVLSNVGTGAILRTISQDNSLLYNDEEKMFEPNSKYTLILEEQDAQKGDLLESVEVYVKYKATDAERFPQGGQELLLEKLSVSDFSEGDRELPVTTVSYSSKTLVEALGIDESKIQGEDRFEFRLVLMLTNGEVFTNTDVGGPVSGGSYFLSPFEYFPIIKCAITESLAGTHTYETINAKAAPGGDGVCSGNILTGEVVWTEKQSGTYASSDMSFGQFEDCYTNRGKATGNGISIVWDCTSLNPVGDVYIDEEGMVTTKDKAQRSLSYNYSIIKVEGSEMTIKFSNAAGDGGQVLVTREGGKNWPEIFSRNN